MGLGPGGNGYTHRGVAGDCVVMDCLEKSVEAVLILVTFVLQQIPDNLREGGFLSFTALEDSAHCHKPGCLRVIHIMVARKQREKLSVWWALLYSSLGNGAAHIEDES